MLKNYLTTTIRNLFRQKLTTVLNIGGLALGLATCLLIAQYIRYEWSYDRFYEGSEQVYRLNTFFKEGLQAERFATTPPPLAEAIREQAPGVEAACRVFHWSDFTMRPDNDFENAFRETNVYAVDEDFFEVFNYGLLAGNPATALKEPASVVLPESAAIRYFGEQAVRSGQVVGRQLRGGKDAGTPWQVTGLMADQPKNSHFQFDFLISASSYPDDLYRNPNLNWNIMHTYLRVQKNTPLAELRASLEHIAEKQALPTMGYDPQTFASEGKQLAFLLQPLTDIHLTSHYQREMHPNGSLLYVRIFGLAGLFILLIACVNYINLYTAQSFRRAKEVGVRKVMGAGRAQLARQFLFESAFSALLASVVALALVEGLRHAVGAFIGIAPFTEPFVKGELVLAGGVLFVAVALLSGAYPAFYLSWFNPAEVLKGRKRIGLKDVGVRNALVAVQFVLSIGLLAGAFVVQQQLALFQHKNLGFDKENVLVIENDREIEEQAEAFKEELRRHSGILNASFSNGIPGLPSYHMRDFRVEGSENALGMNWYQVDDSHLATLHMKVKEGRGFDSEIVTDSFAVLLNEAAARQLGLKDPIGQFVVKNVGMEDEERLQVIGVLKDFNLESLHQPVAPLALQYFKGYVFKDYISIRLAAGNPEAAIGHVEKAWKQFEPGVPIRYSFLDADYDSLYRSEQLLSKAFALFSALALFIAGLGLFGLATYVAEQRTKEIGIRKVLGATVANILQLLSRDFLRLVAIAFLIATPLAWWGMRQWLQGFAYRVELHGWVFVLAGGIAAALALLSVGIQALRAALADPVKALRNE